MTWQYLTLRMKASGLFGVKLDADSMNEKLNSLGREGWELTSGFDLNKHHGISGEIVLILKRPGA